MKKILLTIIVATFVSSLCFAAEQTVLPIVAKAAPKAIETRVFTGKIESVSLPDIAKGTKSEITAENEKNQKLTFLVKSTTTIYDAYSNTMLLDSVKKDSNVKVAYITTKEGVNEATSIRIQK
ncbi:MAG: hypothetical protein NTV71_01670 [Candidatus Omnitrophica bacterium]|nr:hypothetical protein [Candidatus Omnitrophota bacterium]